MSTLRYSGKKCGISKRGAPLPIEPSRCSAILSAPSRIGLSSKRSPPAAIGEVHPAAPFDQLLERVTRYVGYTPLQNLSGTPAISMPLFQALHCADRLDVHCAARGEELLLELAHELEQACPWLDAGRRARLSAVNLT